MDVSKTIFAENWQLFERKGRIYLQENYGVEMVLSPDDAREIWPDALQHERTPPQAVPEQRRLYIGGV